MKRAINVSLDVFVDTEETELEACNRVADTLVQALEPYVPAGIADFNLEVMWVFDGDNPDDEGHEPEREVTRG